MKMKFIGLQGFLWADSEIRLSDDGVKGATVKRGGVNF
jgi:hypothetical protein